MCYKRIYFFYQTARTKFDSRTESLDEAQSPLFIIFASSNSQTGLQVKVDF